MTSLELFPKPEYSPREKIEWGTGRPNEHRNLWVPRSATWTYTGEPAEQKYSLTQLKHSHVRSTDELVPRPQDSVMMKDLINLPFPAEHPYSSHISRFAVFPKFDSPEDPKRGVAARSEQPISAEMPAQPYDIIVLEKTKGSAARHVIQAQPTASERKALYWPGENFFDQRVKAHGGQQQFYPFPPKSMAPNLQSRPEDLQVNPWTANALRNLERAQWLSSYNLDYTGLGPSNPLVLDNLDSKLTTKIMTRLDDDKLYPHFINTFDPPRGMEGRLARKITPSPAAQRVLESSLPENPGYRRKLTLTEREEQRLLHGNEHANLPDFSSGPLRDIRRPELDLAAPALRKIEETKTKKSQHKEEVVMLAGMIPARERAFLGVSRTPRDEAAQDIERWKLLEMQYPDYDIITLRRKYKELFGRDPPDTFYNCNGPYCQENAGLHQTSYDPRLLAYSTTPSGSEAGALKSLQGSHLSEDNYETLKWSRNLSVSEPDLRACCHDGEEVLQAYRDFKQQQQQKLLPYQTRVDIQEKSPVPDSTSVSQGYNTHRVRSRSVPRPAKNVQFSRSVTVATMSPNAVPVMSVETQPLRGDHASGCQNKVSTTQYTSTHAMYRPCNTFSTQTGTNSSAPPAFSSLPAWHAREVSQDLMPTPGPSRHYTALRSKSRRPATSSGFAESEYRDQFQSQASNFVPTDLAASTPFVSSYQNQYPVYNLTYKHDPRFDWQPGCGTPRPQTSLLHLQDNFVKSEIRQRFHEQFPEINPDLRLNAVKGKKHNFYGVNAQVIHG